MALPLPSFHSIIYPSSPPITSRPAAPLVSSPATCSTATHRGFSLRLSSRASRFLASAGKEESGLRVSGKESDRIAEQKYQDVSVEELEYVCQIQKESNTTAPRMQDEIPLGTSNDLSGNISDYPSTVNGCGAPLLQALKDSAEQDIVCFYFPGHNRGKAAPPLLSRLIGFKPFQHDLPELPELDDLFSPRGVILDAQRKAAELFGSSKTWFLVGGTTCGIQASIMATCCPGETLILPRNSHISVTSGLVLSGAVPKYIIPEYNLGWDIAGGITASQVEKAIWELEQDKKRPSAVLVTSPTYHGICSNIRDIAKLCHVYDIPLIIDEAHGAHFKFHPDFPGTSLEQGADIVVQSTHKVLSSLTQSSMLHSSGDLVDDGRLSRCLQMLQTSSPNYLLLASLDAARAQLSENPDTLFNKAMDFSLEAREQIERIPGISVLTLNNFSSDFSSLDPLRLTIGVSQLGISGYLADDLLSENRVICELVGTRSLTFAINMGTKGDDIETLISGLRNLSAAFHGSNGGCEPGNGVSAPFSDICRKLSPREAFFANKRVTRIEECLGEISGELICSYPPGIPILVPGEVINKEALSYLLLVRKLGASISGAADKELSSLVVCDL